jgi:hypothetical protein
MCKKCIFLLFIILTGCSKTGDPIVDHHTGYYKGKCFEASVYSSNTRDLDINVTAGSTSNQLNMTINGMLTVATLTADSFRIPYSSISEFQSGEGVFAGDTLHISYNTMGGSVSYFTIGSAIKQ